MAPRHRLINWNNIYVSYASILLPRGVTFHRKEDEDFFAFAKKKAKTLLIPYYIYSCYFLAKPIAVLLLPQLNAEFQTGRNYANIGKQFIDVLFLGKGLWFLTAYFVGELLMYGTVSLSKGKNSKLFILCIGIISLLLYSIYHDGLSLVGLPFDADQGVQVLGYMCFGYCSKTWLLSAPRKSAAVIVLTSATLLAPTAMFVIRHNGFGRIILGMFAALSGIFLIIGLSILIGHSKSLSSIGRNSLVYYVLNALTLNVCKLLVFRILGINATALPWLVQFAVGAAVTLTALLLLAIENRIVQRWLWWSIGKPRPVK
ncbi:MAG: hypothetical protein PUF51_02000 [Bifidobacteriaceae bacterium]|nr:hypothetical protein [Bifidobacteriaceae bacterium]